MNENLLSCEEIWSGRDLNDDCMFSFVECGRKEKERREMLKKTIQYTTISFVWLYYG